MELVFLDKLSYYRNIINENSTRCEEVLLLGSKCSSYLIKDQDRKNFTDMEIIRLVKEKIISLFHQRLHVEHLILKFCSGIRNLFTEQQIKSNLSLDKNININKNSLSENKEFFSQWLVGFTDGDGSFSIIRQNNT